MPSSHSHRTDDTYLSFSLITGWARPSCRGASAACRASRQPQPPQSLARVDSNGRQRAPQKSTGPFRHRPTPQGLKRLHNAACSFEIPESRGNTSQSPLPQKTAPGEGKLRSPRAGRGCDGGQSFLSGLLSSSPHLPSTRVPKLHSLELRRSNSSERQSFPRNLRGPEFQSSAAEESREEQSRPGGWLAAVYRK